MLLLLGPEVVTHETFASFVRSRRIAIVQVAFARNTAFSPEVIRHFAAEYHHDVHFGSVSTAGQIYPWLQKHVGHLFPAQIWDKAPPGYYLFVDGHAAAHCGVDLAGAFAD